MEDDDGVEWEEEPDDIEDAGEDVLNIQVIDRGEGGEQPKGKGKKRGGGPLELGEEGGDHKKKKARKPATATLRYDNKSAQSRCSAFLSESIGSVQRLSDVTNDDALCGWVLSVVPARFTDKIKYDPFVTPGHLQDLLRWFKQTFKATDFHREQADHEEENGSHKHIVRRLASLTEDFDFDDAGSSLSLNCSCKEIVIVCAALLRLMGVQTRIVCTVDPPSWKGKDHGDLCEQALREFHTKKKAQAKGGDVGDGELHELLDKHRGKKERAGSSRKYWIEFFQTKHTAPRKPEVISLDDDDDDDDDEENNSGSSSRGRSARAFAATPSAEGTWIHCDPVLNKLNAPVVVIEELRSNRAVEYCVACDGEGRVVDVTTRYEETHETTLRLRCPALQGWWTGQLAERNASLAPSSSVSAKYVSPASISSSSSSSFSSSSLSSSSSSSSAAAAERQAQLKKEQEEFERRKYNQPLPSTLKALHDHPLFVVDNCEEAPLKANECINPNKTKGNLKGFVASKKVYPRFVVEECKSRVAWKRTLRIVPLNAVPCKTQLKKARGGEEYTSELYGLWQTLAFVQEKVSPTGEIPTNQYGNVEVWDGCEALVPTGARFIACEFGETNMEHLRKIANKLGATFKDALTGFESKAGVPQRQPKLGGIVVLDDDYDDVIDAIEDFKQTMLKAKDEKKEKLCVGRWESLVRVALSREALKQLYGH